MQVATGSYRTVIKELLLNFKNEVDTDILQYIQAEIGFEKPHLAEKVLNSKHLIKIYHLMLQDDKNNFKKLVLRMIDLVFKYIKDIDGEIKTMMDDFKRRMSCDVSMWMLQKDTPLYGRDNQMSNVCDRLLESEHNHVKLINIWGSTGIGKSFFVKHLATQLLDEGEVSVVYVDVRNAMTITDLLSKVLLRFEINEHSSATPSELAGRLMFELGTCKEAHSEDCLVIILDDVSRLMASGSQDELLFVLHQIITHSKRMRLKFIVTSCQPLAVTKDVGWSVSDTSGQVMTSYTHSLELGALAYADTLRFPMDKLISQDKHQLLTLANGQPYALNLFNILARDSSDFLLKFLLPEMEKHITPDLEMFIQQLLQESFSHLTPHQRKILFALALFDDDATLGTICEIVDGVLANVSKCSEVIQHDFNRQIWLSFRVSDQRVQRSSETTVSPYHSIVREFLRQMLVEYKQKGRDQEVCIQQVKYAYISHYVSLLVYVGSDCDSNPQQSCETLVKERTNIRRMIDLIAEVSKPELLFSTVAHNSIEYSMKCETDVSNIFLCLFVYRNSFSDSLPSMLRLFCSAAPKNLYTALLWTLHILLLTTKTHMEDLESSLKQYEEGSYLNLVYQKNNLFYLCKAIFFYAKGKHLNQSDCFEKSVKALRKVNECEKMKKLFTVHVKLAEARLQPTAAAQKCYDKASSYAVDAQFLKPLVFTSKADAYVSNNQDTAKAIDLYMKADSYYKKLNQAHLDRNAGCLYNIAELMSKQAFLLSQSSTTDAMEKLEVAKQYAYKAFKIRSDNSIISKCKDELLQSCEQLASCHHMVAELRQRLFDQMNRVREETSEALHYYTQAYNLIYSHSESCNLSAHPHLVDRLLSVSTDLLSKCSPQLIEAVTSTLRAVRARDGQLANSSISTSLVGEVSTISLRSDHTTYSQGSDDLNDEACPAKRPRST